MTNEFIFYAFETQVLFITVINRVHRRICRQCLNRNRCHVVVDPGTINKPTQQTQHHDTHVNHHKAPQIHQLLHQRHY